jgi:prolyl-tRNA synthetase
MSALEDKYLCLAPWCDTPECEQAVKLRSKEESQAKLTNEDEVVLTGAAKTLCIPYDLETFEGDSKTKCFHCGQKAKVTALWGRSY